jgi:hypothetical protein
MSERYGIAEDVWQRKTKDLLTVCTKNLQELTAWNEKLVRKLGNRQFCKNLNKCSLKFYGVFIITVQWIMT